MDILLIENDQVNQLSEMPSSIPDSGFLWLDIIRDQDNNWHQVVEKATGVVIHDRHINDSLNVNHPSYYDGMDQYEMIIFRGLSPAGQTHDFTTRPAVFFLMPHRHARAERSCQKVPIERPQRSASSSLQERAYPGSL